MALALTVIGFSVGALVCLTNAYLSFLRYPLFLRRGGKKEEFQWVSGIPVIGSVLVVAALVFGREPRWLTAVGVLLILLDTGGPHWFVFVLVRDALAKKKEA